QVACHCHWIPACAGMTEDHCHWIAACAGTTEVRHCGHRLAPAFTELRVIPAKAGIQVEYDCHWIPACAGMTEDHCHWIPACAGTTSGRSEGMTSGRSDGDGDLAEVLAAELVAERLRQLLQREAAVDHRPDAV